MHQIVDFIKSAVKMDYIVATTYFFSLKEKFIVHFFWCHGIFKETDNECHGRFSFVFEVPSCFALSYVLNPEGTSDLS